MTYLILPYIRSELNIFMKKRPYTNRIARVWLNDYALFNIFIIKALAAGNSVAAVIKINVIVK